MRCGYCGEKIEPGTKHCPHCGNDPGSGVYQTSTILISTREGEAVYASVPDVPPHLRARLVRSTTGANAGTIVIADRRGRQEIAKAMRRSPAEAPVAANHHLRLRVAAVSVLLVVLAGIAALFLRY
jgi:hypothetical protein